MSCWSPTITRAATAPRGCPRRRGPSWFATARSTGHGGENVKNDLQSEHRSAAVLTSLQEHWSGLTLFVDDPRIPMDNNLSERRLRGPGLGRKNYYGSGALWSGRLAATLFSILATLQLWHINPRLWLNWYLQSCAEAGSQIPNDIEPFLPWNLSEDLRAKLRMGMPTPKPDTS